jgi:hypothetical protein
MARAREREWWLVAEMLPRRVGKVEGRRSIVPVSDPAHAHTPTRVPQSPTHKLNTHTHTQDVATSVLLAAKDTDFGGYTVRGIDCSLHTTDAAACE